MNRMTALAAALALSAAFVLAQDAEEKKTPEQSNPTAEALRLIDQGRAAVVEGRNEQAVHMLQEAIAIIQRVGEKGLVSLLPDLGEGWTAEDPQTMSGSWGTGDGQFQWTQVTRRYVREDEPDTSVEVTFSTSPQLLEAQRGMIEAYKNPAMLEIINQQDPDRKLELIDEGEWAGWMIVEKGGTAMANAFHKSVSVSVSVEGGGRDLLMRVWKGLDREKLGAVSR